MGDIVQNIHGERNYIFEDSVEGYIGEYRFDSMSEKRREQDIAENNEKVGVEKNLEQNGEENYQGFSHGNGNTIYGNAMRGKNSNIARRCRFEW